MHQQLYPTPPDRTYDGRPQQCDAAQVVQFGEDHADGYPNRFRNIALRERDE
jgi:hypothetical protein